MNLYELRLRTRRRATISLVKDKPTLPVSTLRTQPYEPGRTYYNAMSCKEVFGAGFDLDGLEDFGDGTAQTIAELLVACDDESE